MFLIIKRSDGGVSVRQCLKPKADPIAEVAEWEARPRSIRNGWTAVSWREATDNPRPADREFRDAWEDNGNGVEVNLAKAQAIQQERIALAKRTKARELLDREFSGENVSAEKARLVAINENALVQAARDEVELKTSWPDILPNS